MLMQGDAGNSCFLFWLDLNYSAKNYVKALPDFDGKVKPDQKVFLSFAGFSGYASNLHH